MKTLVSLQEVYFRHDSTPLFEGLSFSLNEGEKVAIVGHNGCGKSTLLSIIDRKLTPERGIVTHSRGLAYATVEQFLPEELTELPVREAMLDVLTPEQRAEEAYRVDIALADLFFAPEEYDIPVGRLSGGQKNRLMMARAIVNDPDLVLMDEPTNHMDLKTLLFMEDYLRTSARFSFVLISHDRRFLDNVTQKTIVVRDGTTQSFNLPYSRAMEELARMDEHARRAREQEEKEIERLQASAHRLATWGRTFDNEDLSRKAKSMEKRIDKLSQQKTFVSKGNPYQLELSTGHTRSKLALQFHGYPVYYGDELRADGSNLLFAIGESYIKTGERVAILGENGVGKTTFLQSIVRQLRDGEELRPGFAHSPNLTLGLYDQEQAVLDGDSTIVDEVRRQVDRDENTIKKTLITAGFAYRDHNKSIASLSGGERARVIFLILSLKSPNFLILDEPTNHIDVDGRHDLEGMLLASQATILLTGHDREFIDRVATRFLMITNGGLLEVNSADEFYHSLLAAAGGSTAAAKTKGARQSAKIDAAGAIDEDGILARIEALEKKLADDLARKKKFQKPARQEAWRAEIAELYVRLE